MNAPLFSPATLPPVIILTGYYGVGKTNLALNLALDLAQGTTAHPAAEQTHPAPAAANPVSEQVTLVDLDIVNPYFRSSDYRTLLGDASVELIAPVFAGTTLDTPALAPQLEGMFARRRATGSRLIIDLGGDDAGARVLGRYLGQLEPEEVGLYYVVNHYRNMASTVEESLEVLHEIERACGLAARGVINNSHLQRGTTAQLLDESLGFAQAVTEGAHLPLVAMTWPIDALSTPYTGAPLADKPLPLYPIKILVSTPWDAHDE